MVRMKLGEVLECYQFQSNHHSDVHTGAHPMVLRLFRLRHHRTARQVGTTWGDPGGGCDKRTKIESVGGEKKRVRIAKRRYLWKCNVL